MSGYTDEVAIETHDVMEQANIAEEKMLNECDKIHRQKEKEQKQHQQKHHKKEKELGGSHPGESGSSGQKHEQKSQGKLHKVKEALNMK